MPLSRGALLGLASGAVLTVLATRVPAQTPPAQTTFRGGTEVVALDFLAIDRDGAPIGDLKASDLKLTVDGKARTIQSLQFLELAPGAPAARGGLPLAKAIPAPFGSNQPRDAGRTILLLFHHTSIEQGDERIARDAMERWLDTLTARDRVGLITFPQGAVLADLTTDHERVRAALRTVTGHAPRAGEWNPSAADQTHRYVVRDLAVIVDGFRSIDGPKTVVLVSQSMPSLSSDGRNTTIADYDDLEKAASRVSAHFFIIQPHAFGAMSVVNHYNRELTGNATSGAGLRSGTGIEDVAGAVGGEIFSLSGGADTVFERVARESSAYYLLGFAPTASERNGKSHKIGLSTSRPGVTIRARPEFLIDKLPAPPKTPAKGAPAGPPAPETLLTDLTSHADLPLRTVAYSFRAADGAAHEMKVIVAVESPAADLAGAAFALFDPKGRVAAVWSADAQDVATSPVVSAMFVPAGTYRARAAARDATGRLGAVDYEFAASLTKVGSIEVGALMTGVMRDKEFQPRFTVRSELEAMAYTEVYGVEAGQAEIRFELADTADGPARETAPATISATKDPDRWIVTGAIPIAMLAPGDVVVRAVITSGGATGQIVRTLRKTGRE